MTTEAGKRLIAQFGVGQFGRVEKLVADIEAEAVATERERIRAAVEKYIAHHSHEPGKNCVSAFCAAGLHAAVLRIIEETP